MSGIRTVIVGAGSHFTLGLLGDFLKAGDLWGSELVLMDINEERLRIMEKIVKKAVKSRGADLRILATRNLEEAIENTDFVIITIRSGGLETLKKIIEIPLRHGTVEVVGDTVGPSGILKGLVEIPAIVDIALKIRDAAPNALVMNFTNPMTPICEAIEKAAHLRAVGLCHGVHHIRRLASKILKLPDVDKVEVEAAGINHFTWTVNIEYEDTSIYDDFMDSLFSSENDEAIVKHPYLIGRELCSAFGVPPTLSDRHTSEFFHYLYDWINDLKYGPILKRISGYIEYEKKTLRKEVVEKEKRRMQNLLRMAEGREEIQIVPSGEYAVDIISALRNRKKIQLLAANVPNKGALVNVSLDNFVEVPVQVSEEGIRSTRRFTLPRPITSWLNLHLEKFQLLVDGIIEKERNLILQAMALDPLTPSPSKAERILTSFIERLSLQKLF
jgi:alpha-galactosidase